MTPMIASLGFALAALCAGVMGFAIQRGGTCTVAAVEEVVNQRSARKMWSTRSGRPSRSSKESMAQKPACWARARECWGCEGRPG